MKSVRCRLLAGAYRWTTIEIAVLSISFGFALRWSQSPLQLSIGVEYECLTVRTRIWSLAILAIKLSNYLREVHRTDVVLRSRSPRPTLEVPSKQAPVSALPTIALSRRIVLVPSTSPSVLLVALIFTTTLIKVRLKTEVKRKVTPGPNYFDDSLGSRVIVGRCASVFNNLTGNPL